MQRPTPRNRTARLVLLSVVVGIGVLAGPISANAGTGADGSTYVLTSFDGSSLVGLNDQGRTLTGALATSTRFRAAQLDKYVPSDPYRVACRAAAADYNAALIVATSDGGPLLSAIGALASLGCKARVVFSPGDPYVPPNPIRILSFQPVP